MQHGDLKQQQPQSVVSLQRNNTPSTQTGGGSLATIYTQPMSHHFSHQQQQQDPRGVISAVGQPYGQPASGTGGYGPFGSTLPSLYGNAQELSAAAAGLSNPFSITSLIEPAGKAALAGDYHYGSAAMGPPGGPHGHPMAAMGGYHPHHHTHHHNLSPHNQMDYYGHTLYSSTNPNSAANL